MIEGLVIGIVVAIVLGGIIAWPKLSEKLSEMFSREEDDNGDNNHEQDIIIVGATDDYRSEFISILIQLGLLSISVLAFLYNSWVLANGSFVLLLATLYLSIFRIPEVYVAVGSSFFTGRIRKERDDAGFSIPIKKPYKEGLHYKPFWWTIQLFSRNVRQRVIDRQEYQIGSGGTVLVSGVVQYRVSDIATYRAAEIGEKEIETGLSSEADQLIIKKLGNIKADEPDIVYTQGDEKKVKTDTGIDIAIKTRAELSEELEKYLRNEKLKVRKNGQEKEIKRELFGRVVHYAEQGYGVEVLTARIDKVDPTDDLKKERDNIQKEKFQVRSEAVQLQHFLNRVKETLREFAAADKEISAEKAIEVVQVSMGLTKKDISEFQAGGNIEGLVRLVEGIIAKRRGGAE